MIGSSENRISYNGNGIATEFAYTFKILEKSDMKVLHVAADGTETLLVSDYYVDMEKSVVLYPGYAPGAEIPEQNRPPILPVGERLVLYREVPITQESALDKHWPFNVIENGLDKLTIICQQIWDRLQRSFYVSESTSTNFDPKVPIEAGKTFRVKDDGTGFEVTEDPGKVIDGAKALLKLTTEQAELAKEQAAASSQSAVSAQNAANTAEKIATDLGLVDEAVQTAVASAEQARNKADVATAKADVATTKASEAAASADVATQKADIATQKADAASTSETNAAQSYTNADAIAAQLTEYLATKETLTAPAVDKTLLIEGAAADAKVVGELKSDFREELDSISVLKTGDINYSPSTENFVYKTEQNLSIAYVEQGIDLSFTDTINPSASWYVNGLTSGHNYEISFNVIDGSLEKTHPAYIRSYVAPGTSIGGSGISGETLQYGDKMVLKFDAPANSESRPPILNLNLFYTTKTASIRNIMLYDVSVGRKLELKSEALKDLGKENFSGDVVDRLNIVENVTDKYTPQNFVAFSADTLSYNSLPDDLTFVYGNNSVQCTFTVNDNPICAWKMPKLRDGMPYHIELEVEGELSLIPTIREWNSTGNGGNVIATLEKDLDGIYKADFVCSTDHYHDITRDNIIRIGLSYKNKTTIIKNIKVTKPNDFEKHIVAPNSIPNDKIAMSFIYNTRTGDCTIMKLPSGKVIMVDTQHDIVDAKYSIYKACNSMYVTHIDYLIISHYHIDHIGNLQWLVDQKLLDSNTVMVLPMDVISSDGLIRDDNQNKNVPNDFNNAMNIINGLGCTKIYPNENEIITIDDVSLKFWNTDHTEWYARSYVDYNLCSLCFTMVYGNETLIFAGDAANDVLEKYITLLPRCNIYKAAHHAMGDIDLPKLFMSAIFPEIVVTMAGSEIVHSTEAVYQNQFALNTSGLQQWCEDEHIPNFITGVIGDNIYIELSKHNYRFTHPARRCIRKDENIPPK